MSNSIFIREATLKDLNILLEFEQGVIEAERPMDSFLKEGEINYYNIPELISAEHIQLLIAEINNEIVASGYVRIEDCRHYHKNSNNGYIGFMYVKPSFRGKKISKSILESLKKWAKEKELKELRLDVYSANESALKAYDRFGFKRGLVNMKMDI